MREELLRRGPELRRRLLLGLVVAVPLVFLRSINDPINVPKLGILIAGVSIVAAIRIAELLQERDLGGLKLLWIPAAALSFPLVIGWLFSPYKGWALWGVYPRMLGLLPYLFVIAFGVLLADAFRGDVMRLAWASVVVGGVAAAYAAIQFVGLDPFEWTVKGAEAGDGLVVSTLGNPNFAGAFFAILLPVALAMFFLHPERRLVVGIAVAPIAVGWVVAGSEAGWAAGVAGLTMTGAFALAPRWRFARLAGALVVIAIGLVVVGSVVVAVAGVAGSKVPATIQRRGDWWEAAFGIAAASPIVGRGPNAFALEHPQYRTAQDVREVGLDITDDPHSVFLSFLTSAGVLGAMGYLIAAGWVVKIARETPSDNLVAAAFLGALTAYFIQSLVSIDTVALRTAGWASLAGFGASVAPAPAALSRTRKKKARQEPLRAVPLLALLVLVGVAGVWLGAQLILSDARFRNASDLLAEGQGQPALDMFERSISFNGNVHYRRVYGNVLADLAVSAGLENGQVFMHRARQAFSFVHELPQVNATLDYARSLKDWASIDPTAAKAAAQIYSLAVSYDPIDYVLLGETSSALLELKADRELVTMLEPVVERFDQPGLWGDFALAHARLGNREAALEAAERALASDPANATALAAQERISKSSAGSP